MVPPHPLTHGWQHDARRETRAGAKRRNLLHKEEADKLFEIDRRSSRW